MDCFPILAIMNNSVTNVYVWIYIWFFVTEQQASKIKQNKMKQNQKMEREDIAILAG